MTYIRCQVRHRPRPICIHSDCTPPRDRAVHYDRNTDALRGHPRQTRRGSTERHGLYHKPSLSITEGEGGKILLYCHAGCEYGEIIAALDKSKRGGKPEGLGAFVKDIPYSYCDEDGKVIYQAVRKQYEHGKRFFQQRPDRNGGWIRDLQGVRRVLFRLPELIAADPTATVYIVEGERDVENLRALGLVATCNAMGAGQWRAEYNEHLRSRHVVILPDNDKPGQHHARIVANALTNIAASVKVVALPGLREKGDVSDWCRFRRRSGTEVGVAPG